MTSSFPSSLFATIGLLFVSATGCCTPPKNSPAEQQVSAPDSLPYQLDAPSTIITISSPLLQEISGIGPGEDSETLVAIADELGEVYFLDANSGAIRKQVYFRDRGDFEGVEYVDGALFAVKSDGDLYEIRKWQKGEPDARTYPTTLTKIDDVEGLAYDPHRNALLLACKNNPDSDALRLIYAFDLKTRQFDSIPVYSIDPKQVDRLVPTAPDEKPNFFSPSGLAVHPFRREIYVLSTAKKRLVVLDYDTGAIRHVYRLRKNILPQPEGISFDQNGNLIIASEGKKSEGLLLRFNYRKPPKNN